MPRCSDPPTAVSKKPHGNILDAWSRILHSDRGSQYACEACRKLLAKHGFVGSMGRRGNPYDNAKAESFIKTLKVEAVYLIHSRMSSPIFPASARETGHPSPLVTYACPAASAEQVCSPVNIA